MSRDVRTEALHRAAEAVGGRERLRALLGVPPHALRVWLNGHQPPPNEVFLKAVDLISAGTIHTTAATLPERAAAAHRAALAGELTLLSAKPTMPLSALAFLQTSYEPGEAAMMVDQALGAAIAATGADRGNVQLLCDDGLHIVAQRGFEQPFLDFFACVHHGEGCCCGAAIKSGARVIISDVAADPLFAGTPAGEAMLAARACAVQSTPLIGAGGEPVGLLSTHYERVWRPGERELDVVDHIARRTAFWLSGGEL